MDAISDPTIHTIVIMTSAQVGKTEIVNNVTGFFIDQDPSPILVVNPTLEMGKTWSKDRFSPMVRDTPALREVMGDPKARDGGNTILHKKFTGGHLTIAGANSPASLASRPIRILLCDEVDRFPKSAGEEGDPVNLARKRTTAFWNRKIILVSTPTIKGDSRIEAAYLESDRRMAHVTCEDCGERQVLKWANVHWDKDEDGGHLPESAYMTCSACGSIWDDVTRRRMVSNMGPEDWVPERPTKGVAGFWLNELYSPWVKLEEMVSAYLEAVKFPELLKTWINTSLGETWDDSQEKVEADDLLGRREPYGPDVWPAEILVAVAGVDTQDDRLELRTWGFGADEEAWRLEKKIFQGDPGDVGTNGPWAELDEWLKSRRYALEDGRTLRIEAACIDSGGHYADEVVRFCAKKKRRRIFAIKGRAGQGIPVWPVKSSRHKKTRLSVYMVGVDQAKGAIYSRLNRVKEPGPSYLHFSEECTKEDFEQLTSEKVTITYDAGRKPRRLWKKTRERNEELDCAVYARAAFLARGGADLLKARAKRKAADEAEAEEEVQADAEAEIEDTVEEEIEEPAPKPAPKKRNTRPRRGKRGGFVNSW